MPQIIRSTAWRGKALRGALSIAKDLAVIWPEDTFLNELVGRDMGTPFLIPDVVAMQIRTVVTWSVDSRHTVDFIAACSAAQSLAPTKLEDNIELCMRKVLRSSWDSQMFDIVTNSYPGDVLVRKGLSFIGTELSYVTRSDP